MEILHGTKPNQAEYGYVILPGISPVQLEGYANSPDVEIIAQTPALHAVREKTLGITAIALFENQLTQVQDITINKAALLMVRDDGSFVVSDPSRKQGTVTITFPEKIAFSSNNPRVVIDMQEDKTIVKVNLTGMEGKEIEVTK
jgi:hyaluronate lyase